MVTSVMDSAFVFNPDFQRNLVAEIRACMALAVRYQTRLSEPDFLSRKSDNSPVTQADHAVQDRLQAFLEKAVPDWPFIGEENAEEWRGKALPQGPFWLCDPIDGTQDYVDNGREYAINLALVDNGQAVFGLIAAPGRGDIALTQTPDKVAMIDADGAAREIMPPASSVALKDAALIIGHGRRKDVEAFTDIIGKPPKKIIHCASALKFHALLRGEAQVYLRIRETSEWDIAAGDALVKVLGGAVYEKDRRTLLRYGHKDANLKLNSVFAVLGTA